MGTIEQLWQVYGQWKALTQKEGAALQAGDWLRVQATQERKRGLQSEIVHFTEKVLAEFRSESEHNRFDVELRRIVNELILLESQNNANLRVSLDAAREERRNLDATSQRLRQVHTRYVPQREPVWQNHS